MEHCACGSVKDLIKINLETLSEEQLAFVCCETLKGLVHLHSINIIHHDIKVISMHFRCLTFEGWKHPYY